MGSCNDCDIDILVALTPLYDIEKFGMVNIGNVKHANVLLVTGPANYPNYRVLHNFHKQMLDLKGVIVVGTCGRTGVVSHNCPNIIGSIVKVIPVDVYVPCCTARPEAIIDGSIA